MAELIIVPAAAVVVSAISAAVAAWQANHVRLKDNMNSTDNLKAISKNLNKISGLLCAIRDDYEAVLRRNETSKKATEVYNNWRDNVRTMKEDIDSLSSTYIKQNKKSNMFKKPNKERDNDLASKMKEKYLRANHLCELGAELGDIFVSRVINMNAPDIKDLPTFQDHLKELLHLVVDKSNEVKCIALWGMPGKGKTSIMKNLNDNEEALTYFDFVIWLEVSTKILGIDQLRREIAGRLKLNIDGLDDHGVQEILKEKLKGVRILLLLDDVKNVFELDEIGIDLKDGKCSKIVLTTRVLNVCRPMVNVEFEVKKLDIGEASKMFKRIMGKPKEKFEPRIDKVLNLIVKYLDYLPFLIEKIAHSFKMKNTLKSWNEGYNSLLLSDNAEDENDMISLYNILNACFDELGEAQKKCLFYIALYPEDCDVHQDCLYDCWEAEDLFKSSIPVNSKSSRPNGISVLFKLKDYSLLEECSKNDYVRMHKWIRRAALHRLAREVNQKCLVETGKSLQHPPTVVEWEDKMWISLANNDMKMLLDNPKCLLLSTLFLQKNPLLEKISDVFFQDVKNLKVLNVDDTGITSLPTSTSTLDGVKVIFLNGCRNLSEFPLQILNLSTIEVLDIRCSKIQIIPPEVANLSKLRRFLVSFPGLIQGDNHAIVSKNCNVISAVPNMKELIIVVKLLKQSCKKMHQFVILKIGKSKLQSLTTFKFCFRDGVEDNVIQMVAGTPIFSVPNSKVFDGFLQRRVVSSAFEVYIGDSTFPQIPNFKSYERYLGYGNGKSSRKLIRMLLTKVDALEFRHLDGIQNVSDFGIENLQNVQGFLIESCKDVQAIASVVNSPVLPNLKELYVKKMSVLKRIVKGPILLDSLCKLRILKIENCHLIKELFIFSGHTTLHANFLPHLETLILIDMKSLTSICLYKSLDWPSLKTVQIEDCLKLAELPFGKDNANNLELIKAEKSWWDNLKWQEEEVLIRLSQLFANSGEGQTVTTGRVIP